MILHDFICPACDKHFEELVHRDDKVTPCECGAAADRVLGATKTFHEIVATSLTSKKYKAGYAHHFRKKQPGAKTVVQVPRAAE